jgi:hypothetical protein
MCGSTLAQQRYALGIGVPENTACEHAHRRRELLVPPLSTLIAGGAAAFFALALIVAMAIARRNGNRARTAEAEALRLQGELGQISLLRGQLATLVQDAVQHAATADGPLAILMESAAARSIGYVVEHYGLNHRSEAGQQVALPSGNGYGSNGAGGYGESGRNGHDWGGHHVHGDRGIFARSRRWGPDDETARAQLTRHFAGDPGTALAPANGASGQPVDGVPPWADRAGFTAELHQRAHQVHDLPAKFANSEWLRKPDEDEETFLARVTELERDLLVWLDKDLQQITGEIPTTVGQQAVVAASR